MNAGIKIAGLNINIKNIPFMNEETEDIYVEKYFKEADFEYKVILSEEDFVLKGVCILRDGKKSIYSLDNGNYAIKFFIDTKDGKTICYTFFDFENDCANIYIPSSFAFDESNTENFISLLTLDFLLIQYQRVVMTGTLVNCDSKGCIVSGPTTKSVDELVHLWKSEDDIKIINEHQVIIDGSGDELKAWGTLPRTEEELVSDRVIGIDKIVIANKADELNSKLVRGSGLYKNIIPRISMVTWNAELLEKSMNVVDSVIANVDIYEYSYTLDNDAIDYLNKYIIE